MADQQARVRAWLRDMGHIGRAAVALGGLFDADAALGAAFPLAEAWAKTRRCIQLAKVPSLTGEQPAGVLDVEAVPMTWRVWLDRGSLERGRADLTDDGHASARSGNITSPGPGRMEEAGGSMSMGDVLTDGVWRPAALEADARSAQELGPDAAVQSAQQSVTQSGVAVAPGWLHGAAVIDESWRDTSAAERVSGPGHRQSNDAPQTTRGSPARGCHGQALHCGSRLLGSLSELRALAWAVAPDVVTVAVAVVVVVMLLAPLSGGDWLGDEVTRRLLEAAGELRGDTAAAVGPMVASWARPQVWFYAAPSIVTGLAGVLARAVHVVFVTGACVAGRSSD